MGDTGQRIYSDANGNKIIFNEHSWDLSWQSEHSAIYRTTSNGGAHTIKVTNCGDEQEVVRYMQKAGESIQTDRIKINNQGNVLEHQFEYYSGKDDISRSKTILTTQAPPLWTSIKDYLLG